MNSKDFMLEVIFDFGTNDGADIPYYLMKASTVVAVEANPILCDQIRAEYINEVANGRLKIENVAVTVEETGQTDFYVHRMNHGLSQLGKPEHPEQYDRINIPSLNVGELLQKYLSTDSVLKYYVKVDLENYDRYIIDAMFNMNFFPNWLSVESHSIEVMSLIISSGKYSFFNIIEGSQIRDNYNKTKVGFEDKLVDFSFPEHPAGPFGNDIREAWVSGDDLFKILGYVGMGWRDIHATSEVPQKIKELKYKELRKLAFKSYLKQLYKSLVKSKYRDCIFALRLKMKSLYR